jgi:putative membrane-bound dehydrogenase-like protein
LETRATKRDISYNAVQGAARTAQEQQKLFKLPDDYEIELVVQESEGLGKFVSVYFDQRGRMWTQTAFEYPVDGNENPAAADALYKTKAKDKVVVYPREALNAPLPPGGLTNPTVFTDGLAIPLGILPWGAGDSCYIQHGPDLKLFKDTDGDGRADTHTVILTGFGVQDSHLFPHQFTRAPGGWIWMAQGLFNNSKVRKPEGDAGVDWPKCSMAKMRPDGSAFEVTSTGPNNIWGLVITGEGEAFIQEANDYGYLVMPFYEYAYYPGGMEALRRSYQPEFPPQAEFRMGGTGLSGLALGEGAFRKLTPSVKPDGLCMFVANPIISKVQTLAMHRDGPYWKLEQAPDLVTCDDPFFRPVAMTNGPDGCIYIVDWYNKIISHNEVPRTHPDRDKTRGRIWRVKPKGAKDAVPDFTKLKTEELVALLGKAPIGKSHLAWQTLIDRNELPESHWAAQEYMANSRLGRINQVGRNLTAQSIAELLAFAGPMLTEPTAPSSRNGKPVPVREAYDRAFERFLVRMFLERKPDAVATFLDSDAAKPLPVEARLLASLALEPRASAARVAKLLPQLDRAPGQEEVLRLAQFPEEPGVGEALRAALNNPATRTGVLESFLATRTKLDAAKLTPILTDAAKQLLAASDEASVQLGIQLAGAFQLRAVEPELLALASRGPDFQSGNRGADFQSAQPNLAGQSPWKTDSKSVPRSTHWKSVPLLALRALRDLGSTQSELIARVATTSTDPQLRTEATLALASSKAPDAGERLFKLWPDLPPAQRRTALERLASTKPGAKSIVTAIGAGTLKKDELDAPTVEKLQAVLGDKDPALTALLGELASLFRPVLTLNGQDDAWTETGVTLDGPFTVECWVRLDPGITNADGILGAPGQLDMNFHAGKFRVWVGDGLHDVAVSSKPVTAGLWTHVAAVRDAQGRFRLYQDGELSAEGTKLATRKFENVRIGWTGTKGGTAGALDEFRIWNVARAADEIRRDFDRVVAAMPRVAATSSSQAVPAASRRPPRGEDAAGTTGGGDAAATTGAAATPIFTGWGRLQPGAKIARTSDFAPIFTPDEATALDAKFAKYRALASQPGDAARGRNTAMLCSACHLFKGQGGNIGPDLSGVGAMGTEAILRNLLTPNAAMEAGYRIYRVELKNGDLVDAFFVSEDKEAVVIRAPGTPDRRIAKADIAKTQYLRRSLMPEGLLDVLPPEQVSDLFAYLLSLK